MPQPFDKQWLTVDQQRAWRLLLVVMSQLPSDLNRQLQADAGLSFQDFDVLVHLRESKGNRLRIGELAEALGWERSRTSHHVARMGARGLVCRERVDGDGRGAWVIATYRGLTEQEAAAAAHVELVRRLLFTDMPEEQIHELGDTLAVITRNLGFTPREMWHVESNDENDKAQEDESGKQ